MLVVDDEKSITNFLKRGLTYDGYEVIVASDGHEGLTKAREICPDLIVLDIMLPGIDGMEICRRIRRSDDVPILMLTARDEISDRVEGLDCGADDYLVKPFALDELLARIRALLRRRQPERREVLHYADLSLDLSTREAKRGDRSIELTTKEYELLSLLLRHPGRVLTRDFIMERIWGDEFEGLSNVLEVYVRNLRAKLEAGGETRLIHTIRGAGYALKE